MEDYQKLYEAEQKKNEELVHTLTSLYRRTQALALAHQSLSNGIMQLLARVQEFNTEFLEHSFQGSDYVNEIIAGVQAVEETTTEAEVAEEATVIESVVEVPVVEEVITEDVKSTVGHTLADTMAIDIWEHSFDSFYKNSKDQFDTREEALEYYRKAFPHPSEQPTEEQKVDLTPEEVDAILTEEEKALAAKLNATVDTTTAVAEVTPSKEPGIYAGEVTDVKPTLSTKEVDKAVPSLFVDINRKLYESLKAGYYKRKGVSTTGKIELEGSDYFTITTDGSLITVPMSGLRVVSEGITIKEDDKETAFDALSLGGKLKVISLIDEMVDLL